MAEKGAAVISFPVLALISVSFMIACKLLGAVEVPWWVVLAPLWLPAVLCLLVAVAVGLAYDHYPDK